MPVVILVRHGQVTERGIVKGQAEMGLSETGRAEAGHIPEHPDVHSISEIYTSPLPRARQTARIVGDRVGSQPKLAQGLAERDVGVWQGKPKSELQSFLKRRGLSLSEWVPEHGETWPDFARRVRSTVENIVASTADERILVIGHSETNNTILSHALGMDADRRAAIHQQNACVNRISVTDGDWKVNLLNSQIHLSGADEKG